MKQTLGALALGAVLVGGTTRAEAIPLLQLDIISGSTYDAGSETTVATTPTFTLRALLTPGNGNNVDLTALLADTYYVSAALSPATATGGSLGNFVWAGTTYNVTGDMEYGTPPLDQDPGDLEGGNDELPTHSAFPTFFTEFSFNFSAANTVTAYNVTDAGDTGGTAYYADFVITANLTGTNSLHFDLYNSSLAQCTTGTGRDRVTGDCVPADIDFDDAAPFSHDAQSGPNSPIPDASVPEPTSFLLISAGFAMAAMRLRRKK